jgi:hypothetical protein
MESRSNLEGEGGGASLLHLFFYMKKYKTYDEFYQHNRDKFDTLQKAAAMLKAPDKLGQDPTFGLAMAEAEKLAHFFLNCANATTDLMFGVSASVLDAQALVNSTEGVLYLQKTGGATDRNRAVASDAIYLETVKHHHDLTDLKKYLEHKREDFMSNHYYYKGLCGGSR